MLLLKTEPGEYSFEDLVRDKRARWDGITNAAALGHLRAARKGDEAWIYHTGEERAIVGLARILTDPYPDPKDDSKNARGDGKFHVVDIAPLRAVRASVPLARIKADPRFARFGLVRLSRLSIVPVPPELDAILRSWAGL